MYVCMHVCVCMCASNFIILSAADLHVNFQVRVRNYVSVGVCVCMCVLV